AVVYTTAQTRTLPLLLRPVREFSTLSLHDALPISQEYIRGIFLTAIRSSLHSTTMPHMEWHWLLANADWIKFVRRNGRSKKGCFLCSSNWQISLKNR